MKFLETIRVSLAAWSFALAMVCACAIACGGGATIELRANQPSVFYVDGEEVGRGRFVEATVKKKGAITVMAKADGYKDKQEFLRPPFAEKSVTFTFEVGDRVDGKDSWGRKTDDVDRRAAAGGALPVPGASTATAPPEPLRVPITVRTKQSDARFAIVVGIESYSNALPKADGAVRDAATFANVATEALGVPQSHVVLLTNERATRTAIEARLKEWLPRMTGAATDAEVFFFFAGHGAPEPTTGDAYLVPWDADPKYLKSQGLRISDLHAALAASGARSVYTFLDSCFSGAGGRSVLAAGTRPLVRTKEEGLTAPPHLSTAGLQVYASFAAAGPSEVTGRAPNADAGLFTFHLVTGVAGAADRDADHKVTLVELFDYVKSRVEKDARMDNRDQTPALTMAVGDTSAVLSGR